MNLKLELGTSAFDEELDKVRPHGMTRRQILEKLLNDPNPGLRGDAKWQALIDGAKQAAERRASRPTDETPS